MGICIVRGRAVSKAYWGGGGMYFEDRISGTQIAKGRLPAGWTDYSAVIHTAQSFGRPYTAVVELRRIAGGEVMFFETGECYHQIKFGQGERHAEGNFDERSMTPEGRYRDAESYLDKKALFYSDGRPVKLYAKEAMPGFVEESELYYELQRSRERLMEIVAPGITANLQNVCATAALRTYRLEQPDGVFTLVLGAEVTASEYCLRESKEGILTKHVITPVDGMNLGIGMTAEAFRREAGKFGGAKTAGAKAAYIDWEARKVFGLLCTGEPDRIKIATLRDWISAFIVDPELFENMKRSASDLTADEIREQNELFMLQAKRTRDNRMAIARNGSD